MAILQALYQQDPYWLWLSLASLLVALSLATGSGALMWPAAAAVAAGAPGLMGLRVGLPVEAGVFLILALVMLALAPVGPRRAAPKPEDAPAPDRRVAQGQPGRLIGRIGRASGEFANGVGRVWIDGVEWAAELDGAAESLPAGEPVRITKVVGGVRLQVHPLQAA